MVPADPRGGTRLHDFHPPILASGLFWTIPVTADQYTIAPDGRSASVEVRNVVVVDQPEFPNRTPTLPARLVRLRATWTATAEPARLDNERKAFTFEGWHAKAKLEFSVAVPSLGFRWTSDPIATSSAKFGVIGHETNGSFHPKPMPDLVGLHENVARALLGNVSITNTVAVYAGHEAEGDGFRHDLTTAVVTSTEPRAGETVVADARVLLLVEG